MYPLEEKIDGDYVELVHFLNSLNRRFLITSGKSCDEFDKYIVEDFPNILKIIKSSKTQKELESNLNLLFDHYDSKVADLLAGKGEMQSKVELVFREMGRIKAQERAKTEWLMKGISQKKIDSVSESALGAKKQLKYAVHNMENAKSILNDKEKLAIMFQSMPNVTEAEFKNRMLNAYNNYAKELKKHRERYHTLFLDFSELMYENVAIAEINEQRNSVKKAVRMESMETA